LAAAGAVEVIATPHDLLLAHDRLLGVATSMRKG
jgi:hypothetical protein